MTEGTSTSVTDTEGNSVTKTVGGSSSRNWGGSDGRSWGGGGGGGSSSSTWGESVTDTWSDSLTNNAFKVNAGTVTWDLGGHTYSYSNAVACTVGTAPDAADLTITNGTVACHSPG